MRLPACICCICCIWDALDTRPWERKVAPFAEGVLIVGEAALAAVTDVGGRALASGAGVQLSAEFPPPPDDKMQQQ